MITSKEFAICMRSYTIGDLRKLLDGIRIMECYLPADIKKVYKLKGMRTIVCKIIQEKGGRTL